MTINTCTERELIARLRSRLPAAPDWLSVPVGDDAAVLQPARGHSDVVTTDVLVEDVHFSRQWSSPADIGAKAIAVNLSDLAAMGATPRAVLLSLVLPSTLTLDDFDALVGAAIDATTAARATVVGGNLARSSGPLIVDVTAIGVVRPRRVLTRAGARPGDRLFVTGSLGAAAAGLRALQAGAVLADDDEALAACVSAQRRPQPRLRTGTIVAANRAASACMDLSDGLADAVAQICEASRCGATIAPDSLPVHPRATLADAVSGGEDYELLFAVPRRRTRLFHAAVRQAGEAPVTEIGECTKAEGVVGLDAALGFAHFGSNKG